MKSEWHRKRIVAGLLSCLLLLAGCAATDAPEGLAEPAQTDAVRELPQQTEAPETIEAPETEPAETEPPETTEPPDTEPPADTEPPFFLYLVSAVTLGRGSDFDLHKYISYIDDWDAEVELTVEGSVDTQTVGTYPLTLVLTDDAGNSASAHMTVTVTETAPPTPAYNIPPAQSFADFAATYQTDGAVAGIDVSKWQGYIDFGQVAAAGCEFVIIRIGGYSAGELFEDPYFAYNIKYAKAAGLKVGVYWYSEENSAALVRENAEYLYALLDGAALDFPIFFDWEDYVDFEDYQMSMRDLNEMFLAFREQAEARGYQAALYNSKNFLDKLWSEEVTDGGVWLAHYIAQTDYEGRYFLWQQGLGRIAGVSGDVDVDVFYPDALPD